MDGAGAESFSTLLRRARAALDKLAGLPVDSLVYVFSHGQFIQAVHILLRLPGLTDQELMARFWPFNTAHPIGNCDRMEIVCREMLGKMAAWSFGTYIFA